MRWSRTRRSAQIADDPSRKLDEHHAAAEPWTRTTGSSELWLKRSTFAVSTGLKLYPSRWRSRSSRSTSVGEERRRPHLHGVKFKEVRFVQNKRVTDPPSEHRQGAEPRSQPRQVVDRRQAHPVAQGSRRRAPAPATSPPGEDRGPGGRHGRVPQGQARAHQARQREDAHRRRARRAREGSQSRQPGSTRTARSNRSRSTPRATSSIVSDQDVELQQGAPERARGPRDVRPRMRFRRSTNRAANGPTLIPFLRSGDTGSSTSIDGDQYNFRVRWNSMDKAWYFDVREYDETPIVRGRQARARRVHGALVQSPAVLERRHCMRAVSARGAREPRLRRPRRVRRSSIYLQPRGHRSGDARLDLARRADAERTRRIRAPEPKRSK
jgi:hypothetical protein